MYKIITSMPHSTRENESVVLGTEDDTRRDMYFTRRRGTGASGQPMEFAGHYNMCLDTAKRDMLERTNT